MRRKVPESETRSFWAQYEHRTRTDVWLDMHPTGKDTYDEALKFQQEEIEAYTPTGKEPPKMRIVERVSCDYEVDRDGAGATASTA